MQVAIEEEGEDDLLFIEKPHVGGVLLQGALAKEEEEEKKWVVLPKEGPVEMVEVTKEKDVIPNTEATI